MIRLFPFSLFSFDVGTGPHGPPHKAEQSQRKTPRLAGSADRKSMRTFRRLNSSGTGHNSFDGQSTPSRSSHIPPVKFPKAGNLFRVGPVVTRSNDRHWPATDNQTARKTRGSCSFLLKNKSRVDFSPPPPHPNPPIPPPPFLFCSPVRFRFCSPRVSFVPRFH